MFEEVIADRRERIFKNQDTNAIEEMKIILSEYSQIKQDLEKKEAEEAK